MNPIAAPEPYFTAEEVAEALGVTRRWIYELLYTGRLRGEHKGPFWRIRPDDLAAYRPRPVGWQRGRPRGPRRRDASQ